MPPFETPLNPHFQLSSLEGYHHARRPAAHAVESASYTGPQRPRHGRPRVLLIPLCVPVNPARPGPSPLTRFILDLGIIFIPLFILYYVAAAFYRGQSPPHALPLSLKLTRLPQPPLASANALTPSKDRSSTHRSARCLPAWLQFAPTMRTSASF